jgi:hypothetical protein
MVKNMTLSNSRQWVLSQISDDELGLGYLQTLQGSCQATPAGRIQKRTLAYSVAGISS